MAKIEKTTALATKSAGALSITPDLLPGVVEAAFSEGFAEEKTFSIGNPADNKIPIYAGELIGEGGTIAVEAPDSTKTDPKFSDLPVFIFNPLHPDTLNPVRERIDNIIASHTIAASCRKYMALAKAQGGVARLVFHWKGKIATRKGRQLNDVDIMFRVAKPASGAVIDASEA